MNDINETCYEQTAERETGVVSTNERKWINKLTKLAEAHPNEVHIMKLPEENYGALLIAVPKTWFKISPPRQRTLSEEQRAVLSERLKDARQKRT